MTNFSAYEDHGDLIITDEDLDQEILALINDGLLYMGVDPETGSICFWPTEKGVVELEIFELYPA